jgi:type II secretion system protein H
MTSPTARRPHADAAPARSAAGFTLVELLLVMTLLVIAAGLAVPRLAQSFGGRAVEEEGRRLLALTRLAASRAAAEGVPVRLWIDPAAGRYGVEQERGYTAGDSRAVSFDVDPSCQLEFLAAEPPEVSELDLPPVAPAERDGILFLPDGLIDPSSAPRIVVRQRNGGALALVPTADGLGHELVPADELDAR